MRSSLFFISLFFFCCDIPNFDVDNPFDPQNPSYVAPTVTIDSGPQENDVIDSDNVAFTWTGNKETMTYRYFLDGNLKQDWDDQGSALLQYLDEGEHRFGLQGKYPTDDVSDTVIVNFVVDAVTGPSLMFKPRKQDATIGSELTFQIIAEEVVDLAAAEFSIDYDPLFITIESIQQGELFQIGNQSIFHVKHDETVGYITILTALLDAKSPSVEGSGVLAEIRLTINSLGTSSLSFSGINKFRGSNNSAITIQEKIGGLVIAK